LEYFEKKKFKHYTDLIVKKSSHPVQLFLIRIQNTKPCIQGELFGEQRQWGMKGVSPYNTGSSLLGRVTKREKEKFQFSFFLR